MNIESVNRPALIVDPDTVSITGVPDDASRNDIVGFVRAQVDTSRYYEIGVVRYRDDNRATVRLYKD